MLRSILLVTAAAAALAGCQDSGASRDQIKIVGSSTVYPFTTAVAEAFVNRDSSRKAPVVESTGTGAGMKLFCAGVGSQHPDIVNASRRMKKSEYESCQANGVGEIEEIQIGIDGIALAESKDGLKLQLTKKDVYLALAANPGGKPNAAKMWKDVNPALPAVPIQVYGPPSTSGTRDAFVELIMTPGCEAATPEVKALKDSDKDKYEAQCTRLREDGVYVDKGENDNLIVQNLSTNPNALGLFGYSYLEENADRLVGAPVDGVAPSYQSIVDGSYPGARPLYLYVKKRHIRAVPGLSEFLGQYAQMWGPDGELVKRGLIAAPDKIRAASAAIVEKGTPLDAAALH
jgi:phosphate transport system substrate-binding protein